MKITIVKCVATAVLSVSSATSNDPGLALRTAAYVAKEKEIRISSKLKRLRETIEAPSFETFSPDTKERLKDKYKVEVVKSLSD